MTTPSTKDAEALSGDPGEGGPGEGGPEEGLPVEGSRDEERAGAALRGNRWKAAKWIAVIVASIGLLIVAAVDDGGVETEAERVERLSDSFACPVCQGESVSESNAAVAVTIRAFIAEQVTDGAADDEIRDELVAAYGTSVLLTPPGDGFGALVWILPVVVATGGAALVAAVVTNRTRTASRATGHRMTGGRARLVAGLGLAGFAVLAGIMLARTLGERGVNDELTGGIDESPRNKVIRCQELGSTGGDLLGALECFDEVLIDDPENPEALAYRGWYLLLAAGSLQQSTATTADGTESGEGVQSDADSDATDVADELITSGLDFLDRSIRADPRYPDPLAFRATVYDRLGETELACSDIATLRTLDPPQFFLDQTTAIAQRNGC